MGIANRSSGTVPEWFRALLRRWLPTLLLSFGALSFGVLSSHAEPRSTQSFPRQLAGFVAAVVDGDTLIADIEGGGRQQFRLAWIDAPDLRQPQGEMSRASLAALAAARPAVFELVGEGKGGMQAVVRVVPPELRCPTNNCPKTLDLAHAQLSRGMAWHDRRSLGQPAQTFGQYEHAEFEAKVRRTGLWADRNPTPPWDWQPR